MAWSRWSRCRRRVVPLLCPAALRWCAVQAVQPKHHGSPQGAFIELTMRRGRCLFIEQRFQRLHRIVRFGVCECCACLSDAFDADLAMPTGQSRHTDTAIRRTFTRPGHDCTSRNGGLGDAATQRTRHTDRRCLPCGAPEPAHPSPEGQLRHAGVAWLRVVARFDGVHVDRQPLGCRAEAHKIVAQCRNSRVLCSRRLRSERSSRADELMSLSEPREFLTVSIASCTAGLWQVGLAADVAMISRGVRRRSSACRGRVAVAFRCSQSESRFVAHPMAVAAMNGAASKAS